MVINPPTLSSNRDQPEIQIKSFTAENHPQKQKLCINDGELFVYKHNDDDKLNKQIELYRALK